MKQGRKLFLLTLIIIMSLLIPRYFGYKISLSPIDKMPTLKGNLDDKKTQLEFIDFINKNDGQIVYTDLFVPEKDPPTKESYQVFSIINECEFNDASCGGNEYLVYTQENSDGAYIYTPRNEGYNLKGYWTVMANTAFNQGFSSNVLKSIAREHIKN